MTLARLPPLNALRAFVVSARHRSFGLAAAELHVSAAAIGQQVRLLEDHLGGALFERQRGQLELTALGLRVAPGLHEAFALLLQTLDELGEVDARPTLRISVPPSFAQKWLMPRLHRLHSILPDLELSIEASARFADFNAGDVDCAIRYGTGRYEGLRIEPLFSEAILPVCSPEFAIRHRLAERGPAALLEGVPLLHEIGPEHDPEGPDWAKWLRARHQRPEPDAMPPPGPDEEGAFRSRLPGVRLHHSALVLEAAAAGQGIGLGKFRLAEADLQAGRLVSPFGRPWPLARGYSFVAPAGHAERPAIEALLGWLLSESLSTRAAPGGQVDGQARSPEPRARDAHPQARLAPGAVF